MINELARKIWKNPQFIGDYENLITKSLQQSLSVEGNGIGDDLSSGDTLRRLLQSATTFAASTEGEYNEAAYRIAIAALSLFGNQIGNIYEIVDFILKRMGNFPSSKLLDSSRQDTDNVPGTLPMRLWFEINAHEIDNTIRLNGQKILILTDFQHNLWEDLGSAHTISVTAPTSAGKSYALQHFLISECMNKPQYNAVYLVPTRALINQVSDSLNLLLKDWAISKTVISTIPLPPAELRSKKVLYVLTQERLQILKESKKDIYFDLVIVDESQMLSEDSRGIVLQTVVEKILSTSPKTQIMFAVPLAKNPDIFPRYFKLSDARTINEQRCPVAQNLVFLDVDDIRPDEITLKALINGKFKELGHKDLAVELYDPKSTLAYLSWEFGKGNKNIVYAGGQALCEDIASKITELRRGEETPSKEVAEFAQFVKDHIHPKYVLGTTLEKGVAFHYGNMPAIIRRTIEGLFSEGKIDFLVCTSTLLQGINLPAKNLFMLNPTKGRVKGADKPLTSIDFWNLAGRAGRLGKDYEGNVFLINLDTWIGNPLKGEKRQTIYPSLSRHLCERTDDLIEFIRNKEHPSGEPGNEGVECTFVKLFNDYSKGNLDKTLSQVKDRVGEDKIIEIREAVKEAKEHVNVPTEILDKNITISPYRQQTMLDLLEREIENDGARILIPLHPLSHNAYTSLLRVFRNVHRYFEQRTTESYRYFAMLAVKWMRGDPYREIIEGAYRYKKGHMKYGRDPSVATVIRNVMEDIEQNLRFRYLNYTSCYIDLLKEALIKTGNSSYVDRIPNIPLFLEFGASSTTMVSLMGIGLSRTTAHLLSSMTPNKGMSSFEALDWLKQLRLESIDLPAVCIREIRKYI